MRRDRPGLGRSARPRVAAVIAAGVLCACSSTGGTPPPETASASRPTYGLVSALRALGSGIFGRARVVDRRDGVQVTLSIINLPQGPFRIAFGENPNCSSPNGFSAGQPWAPPGAGRSGKDLVSPMFNGNDGSSETSVFVRGVHTTGPDGVDKRSIIIYTGSDVTDAQPGKPNNRIACGTFEPAQPFEF